MNTALPLRVALAGSGALQHVPEMLTAACAQHGLATEWYLTPYEQGCQAILDPRSGLYQFAPRLTFVMLDAATVLSPLASAPARGRAAASRARAAVRRILDLAQRIVQGTKGVVVLHTLEVPTASPLGILETKQEFGWHALIRTVNQRLIADTRQIAGVFVFDFEGFLGRIGKEAAHDDRLYYLADMRLAPAVWQRLGQEYARYALALAGRAKKCIVLDLDQTLWGGVVGEDGFEGIQLGATAPGNAFVAFQRGLLALSERGMLLAINSRNNPDEALRVLREHPAMVLREERFAAIVINWDDKAQNLRRIAQELQLGLDSLLYLDDDPAQRWLVRRQLPQVTVVDLPDDPAHYARTLDTLVGLDALQLTAEDRRRAGDYAAGRRRREVRRRSDSMEEFLAQLEVRVRLRPVDAFARPRVAQLTQRTNQFNFTTERMSEDDVARWAARPDHELLVIEVADRFGDQGICGALGLVRGERAWDVVWWLLSCRVLGKGVEQAVLGALVERAHGAGAQRLRCCYVPTEKNLPARKFLEQAGFARQDRGSSGSAAQTWTVAVTQAPASPRYVAVSV